MSANGLLEKIIAGRWVAGEGISDAVSAVDRWNKSGISGMVNYLGEDFTNEGDVKDAVRMYKILIDAVHKKEVKTSIAVKPTQLGLSISQEKATKNYSDVVHYARQQGIFVWLDMENYRFVGPTIEMYEREVKKGHVGICIQSYLRRSSADIKSLVKKNAVIRLVKGGYKEKSDVAYPSRMQTTINFRHIMRYLFANSKGFMLATHDSSLIDEAILLKNRHKSVRLTFAMLNGIRNSYARELARSEKMYMYIPFGSRWVSYAYRRMREFENSKLIIRSLAGS